AAAPGRGIGVEVVAPSPVAGNGAVMHGQGIGVQGSTVGGFAAGQTVADGGVLQYQVAGGGDAAAARDVEPGDDVGTVADGQVLQGQGAAEWMKQYAFVAVAAQGKVAIGGSRQRDTG